MSNKKSNSKKKTGFFRSVDWSLFKFDFVRFLGRTYYFRMAILMAIIDIVILVKIFTNINYIWLTIPLTYLSIKAYVNLIRNIYYSVKNKEYKSDITQAPRAQCSSGPPGSGKSSNEAWKVRELAKYQWEQLQQEYWFFSAKKREKLSKEQQEDYDEVMFAYNFEIHSKNKIHCLWSNIPIRDANNHKLVSHKLRKSHLLQKRRLPYRCVLFTDEIGSMFPASKGPTTGELDKLSRLARWIRQFLEAYWTFTEQEFSKTFVDVRRVTGSNRYFKGQCWELKPNFLLALYHFILDLILLPLKEKMFFKPDSEYFNDYEKHSKRIAKLFAKPMKVFKKYIMSIGWRHYQYVELGNSEVNVKNQEYDERKGDSKVKHIYLQSCLNCFYDDRAFRNAYDAKDYDLLESEFVSNKLSKEDIQELFEESE